MRTPHSPHSPVSVNKQTEAEISMNRRRLLQCFGVGAAALAAAGLTGPPAFAAAPAGASDFITTIRSRRSTREYTGEPLLQEDLHAILAAGMSAPSAQNTRPWHFVVLTPGKNLSYISRIIPTTAYTAKAGAAILLCADTSIQPGKELALLSVACCGQNMLLAAHSLGYGAVWVGIYPTEQYVDAWREMVRLPEEMVPVCVIPIGRPAAPLPAVDRTDPARIHYESW